MTPLVDAGVLLAWCIFHVPYGFAFDAAYGWT